jgi:hypothetical protein
LDHIGKSAFEGSGAASNESQKKLQLYHDFLVVLLQEVNPFVPRSTLLG